MKLEHLLKRLCYIESIDYELLFKSKSNYNVKHLLIQVLKAEFKVSNERIFEVFAMTSEQLRESNKRFYELIKLGIHKQTYSELIKAIKNIAR